MYPGVPLVSYAFSGVKYLATPKSVIRTYPLLSNTKFSGLMSLWIILWECKCSNPIKMHAIKNSNLHDHYLFIFLWIFYSFPNGISDLPLLDSQVPEINCYYLGMPSLHLQQMDVLMLIVGKVHSLLSVHSFWIKPMLSTFLSLRIFFIWMWLSILFQNHQSQ